MRKAESRLACLSNFQLLDMTHNIELVSKHFTWSGTININDLDV